MNKWIAFSLCILLFTACSSQKNTASESNAKVDDSSSQSKNRQSAATAAPNKVVPLPDHIAASPPQRQQEPQIQTAAEQPQAQLPLANQQKVQSPVAVKGIYVSAWKAIGASMDRLIALLDRTELNAMVIDAKNDSGQVTYDSAVPLANEIGSDDRKPIADIQTLLRKLKEHHIYTIARVVAFKDPYLCSVRKDLAMHTKSGGIWRDKKGVAWVDPYQTVVQDYNIAIAKEVIQLGFDEVQFDYVRFPENGKLVDQEVQFHNPQNISKADLISQFLAKAKSSIPNASVSADVFGLTTSSDGDMGIGQVWNKISPKIDYISPMVYPSHYGDSALGIAHPDLQPYETVKRAMRDALNKNNQLDAAQQKPAQIRPWLQDFTAKWVKNHQKYGTKQVSDQIRAAKELGIDQFLLWNPSCTYSYPE